MTLKRELTVGSMIFVGLIVGIFVWFLFIPLSYLDYQTTNNFPNLWIIITLIITNIIVAPLLFTIFAFFNEIELRQKYGLIRKNWKDLLFGYAECNHCRNRIKVRNYRGKAHCKDFKASGR